MPARCRECTVCAVSPGKANDDVTLLRRPTARGSSSTERMCRALGLCIHMVPVAQVQRVSRGPCNAHLLDEPRTSPVLVGQWNSRCRTCRGKIFMKLLAVSVPALQQDANSGAGL